MKKLTILILGLFLCGQAYGLSHLGPTVPDVAKGQYSLGFGYTRSDMDVELSGAGGSPTIDVDSDLVFADIGYGFTNEWEGFLRLGITNVESEGGFDGDYDFAYGFGTKINLGNYYGMDWGTLFQINWYDSEDTVAGVGLDFDVYEIQIAFGPTYELGNNCILYGGPFLHFLDGDGNAEIAGVGSGSYDAEVESMVGGFVGLSTNLDDSQKIDLEFQFTPDAQAVSIKYGLRF